MSGLLIMGVLLVYMAALFAIAWAGDNGRLRLGPIRASGRRTMIAVYALSLAVYCTSWTFYGAVGSAAATGWDYLPIYLGPILVFTLMQPFLRKLIAAGKTQQTTSISDFLSARYGRSRSLAALITLIAAIGAIPYFALQLRSVAFTLDSVTADYSIDYAGGIFLVAVLLSVFAILFGTRHLDVTEHNRGMIAAIAVDSIVKLIALLAISLLAIIMLTGSTNPIALAENPFTSAFATDRFITLTVLSMAAILCLPRQFHVTVVECQDQKGVPAASIIFVIYLIAITAAVVPITLAGLNSPLTATQNPDLFVLMLPAAQGMDALTLLTFIGGFAAATGMIIVGGVALSTMITNDLLVPLYLRFFPAARSGVGDLARPLLLMRRVTIIILLLTAAAFAAIVPEGVNLASLGILSFAAVAQFAPALIGALYWPRGTRAGVNAGLIAGFALWLTCLFIPSLFNQPSLADQLLPFGWDTLTNGALLSLGFNAALYFTLSLLSKPTLSERIQASYFTRGNNATATGSDGYVWEETVSAGDLRLILDKCLGPEQAGKSFDAYSVLSGKSFADRDPVDGEFIRFAEKQLARTLGASSARILLTGALAGKGLDTEDVVTLLDETSQRLSFNQELLQATLENVPQGVSVVDRNMRLVAWNSAYLDLYRYPESFIFEGKPVEDIIRYNAERGEFGNADPEAEIAKRLKHLRTGTPHTFERQRRDGKVIKIQGRPIQGGGYVTTFTDVSEYKRIESALRESEQSIRFYTDNIPFPVAYTDRYETIRFSNAAFRRIFAKDAPSLSGRLLGEIFTGENYAERKPYINQAFAGQRVTFDIELKNGDAPVHMQVTYVPQKDDNGAVVGFFGFYQDITQRRRAETALRDTNETLEDRVRARTQELEELNTALDAAREDALSATRSKTRFLAAASHDVLQPLNAARLFNSALTSDLEEKGLDTDLSRKVEQSISSADLLLKTLLNISKLDAGGVTPSNATFRLGDLLKEITEEYSVMAADKGLTLTYVDTGLHLDTDKGLFRSVLQNLVTNAIRYTAEGGILIGCRRCGDNMLIQVCDTGIGIPDHLHREIFREFSRAHSDDTGPGLGLGLATVERICQILGHNITVSSVTGKGSIFSITAPVAEAVPTIANPTAPQADKIRNMTVLCIDNDAAVLDAMGEMLKRWNINTVLCKSLTEARAIYDAGAPPPAMLLLDYQLDHGETGLDVYHWFRTRLQTVPPAVLITAEESGTILKEAQDIGLPVLKKPVEPAVLRALLARTVTASAAE